MNRKYTRVTKEFPYVTKFRMAIALSESIENCACSFDILKLCALTKTFETNLDENLNIKKHESHADGDIMYIIDKLRIAVSYY
jgi:hypothetical protein